MSQRAIVLGEARELRARAKTNKRMRPWLLEWAEKLEEEGARFLQKANALRK